MNGFWGIPISIDSRPTNPQDTDVSTADTIQRMIALARSSSSSPHILSIVDSLIRSAGSNPRHRDLARAVFYWIKRHITFVEDETLLGSQLGFQDVAQELLIAPEVLLSMPNPMGDCDDFATLAATLFIAMQIPVRFVVIAVDPGEPFRFSHVFNRVYLGDENRWISFDSSHGMYLGWEKDERFRVAEWNV